MTDEPHNMNRRQLIRHSAWFGAAVGLAVVGGDYSGDERYGADAEHAGGHDRRDGRTGGASVR